MDIKKNKIYGSITMDVKKNDINAENCDVEIGDNTPEYGIVKVNSDNTVTYSLTDSSWNMDFFNYWLTYNGRKLSQATVKICIHRMKTPKANDDTYTCKRGTTIILEPTVNDENADNCRLEMNYKLFKDFGTLIQSGNNFTFKHNADATRTTDFFTYKLINKSNSSIESNYARVTIDIEEPVKTPIANDDNYLVKMGDSITFDPTENDENIENCDIEIIKKLDTSYGTLTRNGNSFTFKDNADNNETFKIFTYRLVNKNDSSIKSEVAIVAFSIIEIPIAKDDEITLWHWKGKTASTRIKVMKNDLHAENCTIEEGGNEPNHGTIKIIKGFNEIEYTLTDVNATYDSFSYFLVKDGKLQTYATVRVHIKTWDEQIEKQKKEEEKEPKKYKSSDCWRRMYISGNPQEINVYDSWGRKSGLYVMKVLLPNIIGKIYFHFNAGAIPVRFIITYDPKDRRGDGAPYMDTNDALTRVRTTYIDRYKGADSYFVSGNIESHGWVQLGYEEGLGIFNLNRLFIYNVGLEEPGFEFVGDMERKINFLPSHIVDFEFYEKTQHLKYHLPRDRVDPRAQRRTSGNPCGFTFNKIHRQLNVSERTYRREVGLGAVYCFEGNITLYIERFSKYDSKKAYIIVEAPETITNWQYYGMSIDCKPGDTSKSTPAKTKDTIKIDTMYTRVEPEVLEVPYSSTRKEDPSKTLVEKTPTKKEIASFSTELGPPKSDCSCCHFLLNKKVEEDPNFIKKLEEILLLSDPVKSLYELLDKDIEFIEKLKKDPEFLKFNEIMTIEDFERPDDTIGPPVGRKEKFPMFSKCCTPDCFNSFVKMYKEEMKNKSDIKDENKK